MSSLPETGEMFSGCQKLKTPGNLSNWKVNKKADFRSMFENTMKLTGVGPIGEKWFVRDSMQIENMFKNSKSPVYFSNIKEDKS